VASDADASLFILRSATGTIYLLVYVDDLLCAAKTLAEIKNIFNLISVDLKARELGDATYFLHMTIKRDRRRRTLFLSQERFAREVITKFNMENARPRATPLVTGTKLTHGSEEPCDKGLYTTLIGSLLYLAVCTRPDIAQSVGALARYMADPRQGHWQIAKGILRYSYGHGCYRWLNNAQSSLRD
jgi:hypothetical protein